MKTQVRAFVTCQLDYCNKVLTGVSNQLQCMKHVTKDATSWFATEMRDVSMMPVLYELHWLPVQQ